MHIITALMRSASLRKQQSSSQARFSDILVNDFAQRII
jgi:hypothetical protein